MLKPKPHVYCGSLVQTRTTFPTSAQFPIATKQPNITFPTSTSLSPALPARRHPRPFPALTPNSLVNTFPPQPNLPPLPTQPLTRPQSPPPVPNPALLSQVDTLLGKFFPLSHYTTPLLDIAALDSPAPSITQKPAPPASAHSTPVLCSTPTDFVLLIQHIWTQPSPKLQAPTFHFTWSKEAAAHNWAVLQHHNLNLASALASQRHTPLEFGSEFRSTALLQPLFHFHPLWPRVHTCLTQGVDYPLSPIPDNQRQLDLTLAIQRGNHKSASSQPIVVKELLHKEVIRGWQLPLPPHCLHQLPGAVVAPLGLVSQFTINEQGKQVSKHRLTHDQSFNFSPENSVNFRVLHESLTTCRYGTALRRFIHFIVDVRRRHPTTPILLTKLDFKAAYRRLHCASPTAVQAIVVVDHMALLALRLTFGGAPNASIWSDVSELTCDACNILSRCATWNPTTTPQLQSPHQSKYVRTPNFVYPSVPLARAQPLVVQVHSDNHPYTDCYLDDLFTCFLAKPAATWRGSRVALLLLFILGRPIHPAEPLPRDDLLSFDKMLAEGTPAEVQTILGWEIDTHTLLLRLPSPKFQSWTANITNLLTQPSVTHAELTTTIGRLNHAAYAVPTARAFLCHLRRAKQHTRKSRRPIRLDDLQRDELQQWLLFLHEAKQGISLNLLTLRQPSLILRADACEHGLGGYSLVSGAAWRFQLPTALRGRLSLNLLEYVASAVTIAFELLLNPPPSQACILSQLDSTTADFWLQRGGSHFQGPERTIHLAVSRWLSALLLNATACTYSQWIPGEENVVADSLSRDHHLSPTELTHLLQTLAQPQLPQNFHISPLPAELSSKITSWLQQGLEPVGYKLTPTRSTLALSAFGRTFLTPSGLIAKLTPSSTSFNHPNASASLEHLPMPSVKPSSIQTETLRWQHQQSEIPSHLFQRPLLKTTDPTPFSTLKAKLTDFFNYN